MKTLHLTVDRYWFDLIATGVKKTDYRDMTTYWHRRLWKSLNVPQEYDEVQIRNGYSAIAPVLRCKFVGVRLIPAQTMVTYPDGTQLIPGSSYGIDLGKIISIKNWHGPLEHKPSKRPIFLKDITRQAKGRKPKANNK